MHKSGELRGLCIMLERLNTGRLSIKKRIIGTIACLIIYRLLSHVPLPFIRAEYTMNTNQNSALGLFNLITGGNMFRMTVASLGVSPYITASIFVQLLGVLVPSVQNLQKSGFVGQRKLKRLTVIISMFTSLPNALMLTNQYRLSGALTTDAWYAFVIQVGLLICCGMFLSYMGMYIDDHFFGNGLSLILITGIVSSLPSELGGAFASLNEGKTLFGQIISDVMFVVLVGALILFVCWMLSCGVNLPLAGSQKAVDENDLINVQNVLPLKMLSTSVMPVIFASSVLSIPTLLFYTSAGRDSWVALFDINRWFVAESWWSSFGILIYFMLIFMFSRYSQLVELNESEIARSLHESGFVICGVSPGRETEACLKLWMGKLNKMGSLGLCVVAVIPIIVSRIFNIPSISLLGTSLILLIHVIKDTWWAYRIEKHGQSYLKLLPILDSRRKGEAFCLLEKARLNG